MAVTVPVQVTFDCADPHAMARFWAAALAYEKEDHSELVESLLRDGGAAARGHGRGRRVAAILGRLGLP